MYDHATSKGNWCVSRMNVSLIIRCLSVIAAAPASELDCSRRKITAQTHTDVAANRTNFTERTTAIGPCADCSLFGSK